MGGKWAVSLHVSAFPIAHRSREAGGRGSHYRSHLFLSAHATTNPPRHMLKVREVIDAANVISYMFGALSYPHFSKLSSYTNLLGYYRKCISTYVKYSGIRIFASDGLKHQNRMDGLLFSLLLRFYWYLHQMDYLKTSLLAPKWCKNPYSTVLLVGKGLRHIGKTNLLFSLRRTRRHICSQNGKDQ